METIIERNEQTLITNRPLVLGSCEELLFKNKSFDFITASHVLERTDNPEKFLSESMRVDKAGYIETPEVWFEKMCAFTYHLLEVSADRDKLSIRKKSSWKPDEIAKFWDIKHAESTPLYDFLRVNQDINHLRFSWNNSIKFEILNPNFDASWEYLTGVLNKAVNTISLKISFKALFRDSYLCLRKWLLSYNYRNKNLDIFSLLRSTTCHSEGSKKSLVIEQQLNCSNCNSAYRKAKNIGRLFPKEILGFNETRTNA